MRIVPEVGLHVGCQSSILVPGYAGGALYQCANSPGSSTQIGASSGMLVRIYTGDDGQSHFEDSGLPESDVQRIATKPGEDLVFRRSAPDRSVEWHNPTRRQYLIVVSGQMEVSVADGSVRQFQAGDVLLAEDMTGQGHLTKAVGGPCTSVSMGIPDL